MPDCYVTNPQTPYGILYLPESPRENCTVAEGCHRQEVFDSLGGVDLVRPRADVSETGRIEATEAIVVLGVTPPQMKYFR